MTVNILFSARPELWESYEKPLAKALATVGVRGRIARDFPPDKVDYIVYAPNPHLTDFAPFTRCKAVLSLWAGVENIVSNQSITMPIARMVDPGLNRGMAQWVAGHVLRYHLGLDQDILRKDREWVPHFAPLTADRQVCILGLGAIGQACAQTLRALDFQVSGWSRSAKNIPDVQTYSGASGLVTALKNAEILVVLLPLTAQTDTLLDADMLRLLPDGAMIINAGRGPLIDDAALLAALDCGQIAHATLDVFRTEPLPQTHEFWAHPNVTVTPHIASETRPETAVQVIAENIERGERGASFLHLVDRMAGY